MSLKEALKQDKEIYPVWLDNPFWLEAVLKSPLAAAEAGKAFAAALAGEAGAKRIFLKQESKETALPEFPAREIFRGRVVYYPGAGTDARPLKIFCGSRSAHCFIYADYMVKKGEVMKLLEGNLSELQPGYKTLFAIEGNEKDFFPLGWEDLRGTYTDIDVYQAPELKWGFWAVLERNPELDESHGPRRILFCYLACDAVSGYASLWPRGKRRTSPYAIVIDDSGFASNWAVFGSDKSQMYKIGGRNHAMPNWLLVATGRSAKPWPGSDRFAEETESPTAPAARMELYINTKTSSKNKQM